MLHSQISTKVAEILSAEHPVHLGQLEIVDLAEYTTVYSDGTFSDDKEEWYYNPSSMSLIRRTWSLWQGSEDIFVGKSFADYMNMMPSDVTHFDRWVNGLRLIVCGPDPALTEDVYCAVAVETTGTEETPSIPEYEVPDFYEEATDQKKGEELAEFFGSFQDSDDLSQSRSLLCSWGTEDFEVLSQYDIRVVLNDSNSVFVYCFATREWWISQHTDILAEMREVLPYIGKGTVGGTKLKTCRGLLTALWIADWKRFHVRTDLGRVCYCTECGHVWLHEE